MKTTSTPHDKNSKQKRVREIEEKTVENLTPRHSYLIEKEKIKNEIGDLDAIRLKLGLSQRRVCQLLLVDPSAWTRWLKSEAPPHIYQALKWLLELRKVNPEAAGPSNIESRVDFIQNSTQSKIKNLEASVEMLERSLALQSTVQPIIQTQDSRLEAEFAQLKAKFELLLAAQAKSAARPARKARQATIKKPIKKSTKKPLKKAKSKAHTKIKAKLKAKPKTKKNVSLKAKPKLALKRRGKSKSY